MFRNVQHKVSLVLILVAVLVGVLFVFGSDADAATQDKVGVCHRTASETNPYVYIEVPADEANGHITGTDKQHNQQVTWPEDGTWRGIEHKAGDLRLDYFANDASECEDVAIPEQPDPLVEVEVITVCGGETTITTTTPYVWNGTEWVLGEPVEVREFAEVPEDCDPPTFTPVPEDPETPPTNSVDPEPPVMLPNTGAGNWTVLLGLLGLIAVGVGVFLLRGRE